MTPSDTSTIDNPRAIVAAAAATARYQGYGRIEIVGAEHTYVVAVDPGDRPADLIDRIERVESGSSQPAAAVVAPGRRPVREAPVVFIAGPVCTIEFAAGSPRLGQPDQLAEVFTSFLAPQSEARTISAIRVLGEESTQRELASGRGEMAPAAAPQVHRIVAEVATAHPDRVAIVEQGTALSYQDLAILMLQTQRRIREWDLAPGTPVGVSLVRGIASAVAQLGAFAAGCPVVLLDPSLPTERLRFMLTDSGSRLLFTAADYPNAVAAAAAAEVPWLRPDDSAGPTRAELAALIDAAGTMPRLSDDAVSHIAYTSGSTGEPKAVQLRHGPMRNTAYALGKFCRIRPGARGSWCCAPGVGMVEVDMFPVLSAGATVVVAPPAVANDPYATVEWLARNDITHTWQPTGMAERMLAIPWPDGHSLTSMRVAGERQRVWPAADQGFQVLNVYGSTEANVVTVCDLTELAASGAGRDGSYPPIGRPVPNVNTYVLDPFLRPVPRHAVGELCISGQSLSRGYLNRAQANADRFLPNPVPGDPYPVLYRSGDLARMDDRGLIEVVGRLDDEVKISGFRVHPGDVEAALSQISGVAGCGVIARQRGDGTAYLVAHVELSNPDSGIDAARLRGRLSTTLAPHMIPAAFVFGPLPLSANGKVDRGALAARAEAPAATTPSADATPTQRIVAEVFAKVLGTPAIALDDHFFELGGGSIEATLLWRELCERLGESVDLAEIMLEPTPRAIAALYEPDASRHGPAHDGGRLPIGEEVTT